MIKKKKKFIKNIAEKFIELFVTSKKYNNLTKN